MTGAVLAVLLAIAAPAQGAGLEPQQPGFVDEAVLEHLDSPTAVRFAPDGRIFVALKAGVVLAYDDAGDTTPATVVDLRTEVMDFWDRGLLGMALAPDFATSQDLYLLYTRNAEIGGFPEAWPGDNCWTAAADCEASGRLVRVPVGHPEDMEVIIGDEWCQHFPSHTVGTVAFGPDGMLYASAGESANFYTVDVGDQGDPPNVCGDPPQEGGMLRAQDVSTPGDPTGLDGAIIRVDPDTGAPAPGNPAGPDVNARRIIAYGLRNPFRFTFRPGTSELWLGDVGWIDWEEINKIPDTTDVGERLNFGWPCYEGPAPQRFVNDSAYSGRPPPICQDLADAEVTKPVVQYPHGQPVPGDGGCDLSQGASVSGIAFAPGGFPAAYEDTVLSGEYGGGCILATRATGGEPDPGKLEVFARRESGGGGPVELQSGPGGALYYTFLDPGNPRDGSLRRIVHRPGAPVAKLSASATEGPLPLEVDFSAAGSSDPDSDSELAYAWDLDGDGDFDDGTNPTASRTYEEKARVQVALRVTDESRLTDVEHITITPGNTSPRPVVTAPGPGMWSPGDVIAFSGSAADTEDTGGAVATANLDWTITIDHCIAGGGCHTHPLSQQHGVGSGSFVAPEHEYPAKLRVTLSATDADGSTSTTSVSLDQRAPADPAPTPTPDPSPPASPGTGPAPPGQPLRLRLTGSTRRPLARRLSLLATCSRRCTLTAASKLTALGRGKALRSTLRGTGRVIVELPAAARARARKALRRKRTARVRVVVTARESGGGTARAARTIRLIRAS